jgi:hypothetical protein
MRDQMFTDRHAAKQLGLVEIDDGHVVAFDIRRIGARALRIDGDAKRMRADLDRAFADKSFRVNNRDDCRRDRRSRSARPENCHCAEKYCRGF